MYHKIGPNRYNKMVLIIFVDSTRRRNVPKFTKSGENVRIFTALLNKSC